ncbi:hypothetical protein B0H14DRAFT_3892323 [Mycena olivaceomarginata]|nr:hypothetical protein B0H14DRAFT_3892323 [Mycena olivaceomarginata]
MSSGVLDSSLPRPKHLAAPKEPTWPCATGISRPSQHSDTPLFFHGPTVAPEQEASSLDDFPHPIASFPAKPSCIQLAAKVRTLYSVRNAPRPTIIEHSIPTLPTPRPSPFISGLSLAIRAPTLNASVAFRYTASPFASLAQHPPRSSICARVYPELDCTAFRGQYVPPFRQTRQSNIQGLRSVSPATFVFQGSDFSRLTRPPTPHPERQPCRLAMLSMGRRYTHDQPCLPLPPIAPMIPGSLPRVADTTTLALRHGDLDCICEDKWSRGAVSIARLCACTLLHEGDSISRHRLLGCMHHELCLGTRCMAGPCGARALLMESEASWNGAQSKTSWGGWTMDDENGAVQRVLFKQALTPASAASTSVRAVGDCSSLPSTLRGYTFPVFSAFRLRCVLLARDTLILF